MKPAVIQVEAEIVAPLINEQTDPQGQFADGDMTGHGSDSDDPGDFGAGKPTPHHLPEDQSGTSLADTDLGKDSDTGENKTTKLWDKVLP
jgi:hypothetical protein